MPSYRQKKYVTTQIKASGIPCFYYVGKHNSDDYPIDVVLKFLELENGYYTFTLGNVKIIVLDANYIKTSDGSESYYKRNYNKTTNNYPYIPQEEIEWLKKELEDDELNVMFLAWI
ncbi:MAG: hypothetical protein WDA24_03580 [Tissierellales bacterium]